MLVSQLLSLPADVVLEEVVLANQTLTLLLSSTRTTGYCPTCLQPSTRVHSRYTRTLADLPCQGRLVRFQLEVRRFLCEMSLCPRKTFAEQFPSLAPAYARRTTRQADALLEVAFALGGRAGARLAKKLAFPTSRYTLLRLLRRTSSPVVNTPRKLGVDDFAWKKGDHYGTSLVDLERQCPVDLLADRSAESLASWLRAHPGVDLISRDRAGAYAEGARKGAPKAIQVADRYHLIANLREALQKVLDRKRSCLPTLAETERPSESLAHAMPESEAQSTSQQQQRKEAHHQEREASAMTQIEALRQMRRHKRYERYQAVLDLHQQGLGARTIAQPLGISRNTVRSYLNAEAFPEQGLRSKRRSLLDPYLPYLRERWQAGCQNAAQLLREIKTRGYGGSATLVRALVSDWRASSSTATLATRGNKRKAAVPAKRRLSSRQASFLFVKQPDALTERQYQQIEQISQASQDLQHTYELAQAFVEMSRKRQVDRLDEWLDRVKEHGPRELKSFARGIRRDYEAVSAAFSRSESNGQVEGQITRLKLLKRQMYGKAQFDVLRLRVLHAA